MQIDISAHINGYIDPTEINNHKQLSEIELGGRCEALLNQVVLGDKEQLFRHDALNFLVELCVQRRKRFIFSKDGVLAQLCSLDVDIALSTCNNEPSKTYCKASVTVSSPGFWSWPGQTSRTVAWTTTHERDFTWYDKTTTDVLLVADSFHKRWDRSTEIWSPVKVHVCIVGLATIISLRRTSFFHKFVCLLLNGTSALFRPLVPRIVEIEHTNHVKNDLK